MAKSQENLPESEFHAEIYGLAALQADLLPHNGSGLITVENESHDAIATSLEELLEQNLKGFGWMMLFQVILIAFASFFDSQQSIISIYTDAIPSWHCTNVSTSTCNSNSDICKLSSSEWAWDEIPSKTIVSEWGLQCSSALLRGLPASSHFAGTIFGVFVLATLADSWFGRKKLLLISCLNMSVSGIITILSNNVWIYSWLRFVCGFGRATIGSSAIVLLSEVVGKQWRARVGTLIFFFFMLGMLCLPTIAYINRMASWRHIYLCVSIPGLIYCVVLYFFVIESPRWLFMQGRDEEAIIMLKTIFPRKDKNPSLDNLCEFPRFKSPTVDVFSSMDLFYRRWSCRRALTLMLTAFGVGLVFYGVTLGIGNLNFNIYLSGMFNGLLDIPAFFFSFFLIENCRRKTPMFILCLSSGIFCVMIAVVGKELKMMQIILSLASFLFSETAFNLILVYSVEMFPTCVRNLTSLLARQAITFGAVVSSLLNSAGKKNPYISYGVFGLIIICSGFCVLILPETKGTSLCDTMDEQERKENIIVDS